MRGQNVAAPVSFLILLLVLIVTFMFSSGEDNLQSYGFVFIGLLVVGLTLVNVKYGIHWLVYSMLLSPEFVINWIPVHHRQFVIRVDDLMIILISLTWLMQAAVRGQLRSLVRTPANGPILLFTFFCVLSTAKGSIVGSVPYPLTAFFTVLKFIEFFLLYFLIVNNIKTEEDVKDTMVAFALTMFFVVLYATFTASETGRATTPFEHVPEPATLGGYLLVCFAMMFGMFLHAQTLKRRMLYFVLSLSIIPPVIFSLSRGTYMAFVPMFLSLVLFSDKKVLTILVLIVGILSSPWWLPAAAVQRVEYTFQGRVENVETGQEEFELDPSSQARLQRWDEVVDSWTYYPLLGTGITSLGLVDSQVMRVLGELGLFGTFSFFWMFFVIYRETWRLYRTTTDVYIKGFSLGLLAATVAVVFHGTTANSMSVVRIAAPYWLLVALMMVLRKNYLIRMEEESEERAAAEETVLYAN